jgi:hypothetical protein
VPGGRDRCGRCRSLEGRVQDLRGARTESRGRHWGRDCLLWQIRGRIVGCRIYRFQHRIDGRLGGGRSLWWCVL